MRRFALSLKFENDRIRTKDGIDLSPYFALNIVRVAVITITLLTHRRDKPFLRRRRRRIPIDIGSDDRLEEGRRPS